MATERDETWWRARAEREEGHFIAAGALAMDPDFASAFRPQLVEREQSRVAFGKFIELMRRSKGWTVEDLASEADLEIGDVLLIEDDLTVLPEPRTVRLSTRDESPADELLGALSPAGPMYCRPSLYDDDRIGVPVWDCTSKYGTPLTSRP